MEINEITERVIGCVYKVSNTLGDGFVEKVDQNVVPYDIWKARKP